MNKDTLLHGDKPKPSSSVALPVNLDVANFPLHGHRLIEASAGTGKTYTIANLYLRLILGHGSEISKATKLLTPREILVVTFTEAATRELRQRIRRRIHVALQVFSKKNTPPEQNEDPLLYQLLQDVSDHGLATSRLIFAERQIDEASIFTIHGFCHRMLSQYAFESGALFNITLTADENSLLQQATNDFWRVWCSAMDYEHAKKVYLYWQRPEQLLRDLRPWIHREELHLVLYPLPDMQIRHQQIKEVINKVKQLWLTLKDDLPNLIACSCLCKKSYSKRNMTNWIEKITQWVDSDDELPPEQLKKFTLTEFEKKANDNGPLPEHPFFKVADEALLLPNTFRDIFFSEALTGVRERFRFLKEQQRTLNFDDLLIQLNNALQRKENNLLRKSIRSAFPIAIIDEFQDTDPVQYRIFQTIYPQKQDDTGLLMIGDPKQAIYAFRGADIFTYINARRKTPSRFTLPVNWRSTSAMVKACNTLFSHSKMPFVYGADIPFSPTDAAPGVDSRCLQIKQQQPSAIMLWYQNNKHSPVNKTTYAEVMTQVTAQEIKRLLMLSDQGECMIHDQHGQRPLAASDIAILVRTGKQAQLIRKALADTGILSVYLSQQESVFKAPEAKDLYRILKACLFHENEQLVRTAIATPLFGLNANHLNQFREDEQAWEKILEEFSGYHHYWLRHGVLSLIRQLLFKRHIAKLLLEQSFGERKLTDLIHLGDLLSSVSQTLDSQQALVHWLWLHIQGSAEDPAHQLHLESDKNLVKVSTIHKAKGLEYPLVFVPYVCDWKPVKKLKDNGCFFHREKDNQPVLDFTDNKQAYVLAEKERLAEDLRLLYVAVTRSVYRCYLGVAPIKAGAVGEEETKTQLSQTAIGYLLNITKTTEAKELPKIIDDAWCKNPALIKMETAQLTDTNTPYTTQVTDKKSLSGRIFNTPIERNWFVTSYSALTAHHNNTTNTAYQTEEQNLTTEPHDLSMLQQVPERNIFTLPKGAHTGVFLHSLFENLSFDQLENQPPSDQISQLLLHHGFEAHWQQTLETLVANVLNAPLYNSDKTTLFSLSKITNSKKYVELEFYLPLSLLHAESLNQLISSYDTLSENSAPLSFNVIQGMLRGFIDLVLIYDNRYYIVDYKSNYLGNTLKDYTDQKLSEAMKAHRYDFQYQLYTLAVHRLLRQRIKNYTYDTHMGGVFYLFLRGMRATPSENSTEGSGVFFTRPTSEFIGKLDRLFAKGDHPC